MDLHEKRTYLVYSRGLMPTDLPLGSLFIDPANPLDGERKRFICPLTTDELAPWLGPVDYDDNCTLTVDVSREWLLGGGALDLAHGKFTDTKSRGIKVSGISGRRVQINRPETFLNTVLLQSPTVKTWLARQLSVSRTVYHLSKLKFGKGRSPHIWLLTGVQYLTNARLEHSCSAAHGIALGLTVPVPEPVSALIGERVASVEATRRREHTITAGYSHEDERIWAAQFTRLNVRFCRGEEYAAGGYIPLKDLEDLGQAGVRADKVTEEVEAFAEVDGLAEEEQEAVMYDARKIDWELVDEYLDEYLDDEDEDDEDNTDG